MAGCVHCGTARTAPGSTHPPGRNSDLASPSNQSTRPRARFVIASVGQQWFECPTPQCGRNGVEGVGSIPGPRAPLPASSLHVPVVSPVGRAAFECGGFRSGSSGWPDRARVASDGRLRARMPADQSASRPGHTLLSRGDGEGGGGAGLLWTSIPPGWVPSLVRRHPCPHLLCTSQQSHLFGDGF